ncbi:DUF2254 domain-containing protein [Galbibacter mesophilus]|uniref:DUF2254 domain-containing protein n=1 Tax=Galbibacter mesophilus TaxID=379069 RepID=UPI00191CCD77|nr:DUF2254 domain-containing protein [Galbibacter mesophilus]MCM5663141.1 DUF2254 domain-containing protein [Galbibacter mesophilus]
MKLLGKLKVFFSTIKNQIAFYPTIITIIGCVFAFLMIYMESLGISKYLRENIPMLVVDNVETARSLLSVFIGGLISLMVFSFSMVMVLLNQASNNFSPRILPGLISNRRHQLVLGFYLATLLYCIFILVSIEPTADEDKIPGFAVLISIILTTLCLAAFISFIHSISQSIQINHILENIYSTSKKRLTELLNNQKEYEEDFPDTSEWNDYNSHRSGYFQNIATDTLLDIAEEHNTKFKILVARGNFILEGVPLFSSEKELDEEMVEKILDSFLFSKGELIENNYILAFKQITEITVKAMSPGINDPGTALNAIDYLTELLALRMKKEDRSMYFRNDKPHIYQVSISFSELLYNVMASIRLYCKHDIIILQKLLIMLKYLQYQPCVNESYKNAILKEVETLTHDARNNLSNERDLQTFENYLSGFGNEK